MPGSMMDRRALSPYSELLMEAELMDAELMVPQPETETELLKLIVEYRHMLRTIFGEAINIKYIELIKVDLQTKIFKQHKDNRDPEERQLACPDSQDNFLCD